MLLAYTLIHSANKKCMSKVRVFPAFVFDHKKVRHKLDIRSVYMGK